MPPRPKRSKRTQSSSKNSADASNVGLTQNPTDTADQDNTTDASNVESMDSALLDEEETPELAGDAVSGEARRPQTYAAGGGGFNALKSFQGQVYSGMAVGGSHTWNYDQGVWKETKEEPDLWKIDYRTTKRRARNAPRGSGAPVGTEYHWFIVGHQNVKKIDANTYETSLTGSKYKLAHKTASSNAWSIPTVKGQRDREIELLDDAKRRIQGLPPVHAGEKVKVEKHEKGQQKLDALFGKSAGHSDIQKVTAKRKREEYPEDGAVVASDASEEQ